MAGTSGRFVDRDAHRPRISVIVCAYNEEERLPACLHSVLAQSRPADQLLVVNNGSTDGTRTVAEQTPGVEVVDERRRGRFARRSRSACALSAQESRGSSSRRAPTSRSARRSKACPPWWRRHGRRCRKDETDVRRGA
jgi:hypothetical protein